MISEVSLESFFLVRGGWMTEVMRSRVLVWVPIIVSKASSLVWMLSDVRADARLSVSSVVWGSAAAGSPSFWRKQAQSPVDV